MSNDRELLYIHAALAEKQLELREHWRSITQTLNDTYKDRVQDIIRSIEDVRTSGEYDRHYIDLIARYRISPRSEVESKVV